MGITEFRERSTEVICADGHEATSAFHGYWSNGYSERHELKCPDCKYTFQAKDASTYVAALEVGREHFAGAIPIQFVAGLYKRMKGPAR